MVKKFALETEKSMHSLCPTDRANENVYMLITWGPSTDEHAAFVTSHIQCHYPFVFPFSTNKLKCMDGGYGKWDSLWLPPGFVYLGSCHIHPNGWMTKHLIDFSPLACMLPPQHEGEWPSVGGTYYLISTTSFFMMACKSLHPLIIHPSMATKCNYPSIQNGSGAFHPFYSSTRGWRRGQLERLEVCKPFWFSLSEVNKSYDASTKPDFSLKWESVVLHVTFSCWVIAHLHLLVQVTNEQWVPAPVATNGSH